MKKEMEVIHLFFYIFQVGSVGLPSVVQALFIKDGDERLGHMGRRPPLEFRLLSRS